MLGNICWEWLHCALPSSKKNLQSLEKLGHWKMDSRWRLSRCPFGLFGVAAAQVRAVGGGEMATAVASELAMGAHKANQGGETVCKDPPWLE